MGVISFKLRQLYRHSNSPDIHCKGGWLCRSVEFYRQFFEKYSNMKFYDNPLSGSGVIPCGRTDMTKIIVAFRNFANAPNIIYFPIGNRTPIPLFTSPRPIQYIDSSSRQVISQNNKLPNVSMSCCAWKKLYSQKSPCNRTFCVWDRIQKCKGENANWFTAGMA